MLSRRLSQSIVPLVMLVLLSMNVLTPTVSKAISTTIVISEFRFVGPNGGGDEFIELYNVSRMPVDISGYTVRGSSSTGVTSLVATIPAGVILQPGQRYLITGSTYSGGTLRDLASVSAIGSSGGVALLNGATIVDQVGLSAGSAYQEGTTLAPLIGSINRSYERRPGGGVSNNNDSDNNSADFGVATPSNPQNRMSPPTLSPTGDAPEDLAAFRVLLPFVRR